DIKSGKLDQEYEYGGSARGTDDAFPDERAGVQCGCVVRHQHFAKRWRTRTVASGAQRRGGGAVRQGTAAGRPTESAAVPTAADASLYHRLRARCGPG